MRLSLALIVTSTVSLGGCAAVPLAAVGTIAGIGATAASTGANVYSLGKLDSAEMASIDTTWSAVNAAGQDVGLTPVLATLDDHQWFLRLRDERKSTVDITLDRRTAKLTRLRINVGVFGDEPTARLILQRVHEHLPPTTRPAPATNP